MSKHIAVYVRVSSKQQDTKIPRADLHKWIAAYVNATASSSIATSSPVRRWIAWAGIAYTLR